MRADDVIALAERLLERATELDAVKYGEFKLTWGGTSSFYFDGRLLSTDPEGVHIISTVMLEVVERRGVTAFGGPAVGAVPVIGGMMLAAHGADMPLHGFYVRSERKAHGTGKRVEGHLGAGDTAALYDDTISTGGSVVDSMAAIDEVGATTALIACILRRNEPGQERLAETGVAIFNLFRVSDEQRIVVDHDTIRRWFD